MTARRPKPRGRFALSCLGLAFAALPATDRPAAALPSSPRSLAWETVQLRHRDDETVEVRVRFGLTGDFSRSTEQVFPETEWFELRRFRARFNGRPLKVRRRRAPAGSRFRLGGHHYPALLYYRIPPSRRRNNLLEVFYEFTPPEHRPGSKENLTPADRQRLTGRYVEYVLVTGATWKGPIGRVTVELVSPSIPCATLRELPGSIGGACRSAHRWRFDATNIEPSRDVRLLLPPTAR